MLKFITRLAADNLDVAVHAAGSGIHNKKIRIGTAAEYKKKLGNLFKEKRDSKTGPKGGKSVWAGYNGDKPYQDCYGDDCHQHLTNTFKWKNVRYYNIK